MSKRGNPILIRKTEDVMWALLDNGGTRFGICCDGFLMTGLDVPIVIDVPGDLDNETFEEWVYSMLKPGAWQAYKGAKNG